jgi:endonuclease/exonuclease/phosphatase family metal-dependent hydrolase
MQSDDSRCSRGQAAACRAQAMKAWRAFLEARKIPAEELIIFAGDFNIERNTVEFNDTLTSPHSLPALPLTPREPVGGSLPKSNTDSASNNNETVVLHAPEVYKGHDWSYDGHENSLARYSEYDHRTYIDYVFVVERDNRPPPKVQSLEQTVLKVHSSNYTLGGSVYDDYSDHFPVSATIVLKRESVNNTVVPH